MMDLVLVTFDIDLTQFLINVSDDVDPIEEAIRANIHLGELGNNPDLTLDEVKDKSNYTVSDVEDMFDLYQIIKRTDCSGKYGDVIIFSF